MQQFGCLVLYFLHQMGVRVAQGIGRDTAGEIKESSAIGRIEVRAFSPIERNVDPPIRWHDRGNHNSSPLNSFSAGGSPTSALTKAGYSMA
jgi:hypothetical protein